MFHITERQQIIDATEAAPYVPCFEREYWTGDLPAAPIIRRSNSLTRRLSFRGNRTVATVAKGNNGMLKPIPRETVEYGLVSANELPSGSVVKLVTEGMQRHEFTPPAIDVVLPDDCPAVDDDVMFRKRVTPEYFAIEQVSPGIAATYQQVAEWFVVAENMQSFGSTPQSLFPLSVDFDSSYDAGPYADEANAVQLKGVAYRNGITALDIGVTEPIEPLGYRRTIRAVIGEPVIVPDSSSFMHRTHRH